MSGFVFDHGDERRPALSTRSVVLSVGFAALLVAALWAVGDSDDGGNDGRGSGEARTTARSTAAGTAALARAAARGDFDAVEEELRRGVDPASRGAEGRTALTEAIQAGESGIARRLLVAGASADGGDSGRPSDLALAAEHDDAYLIAMLVGAGGSVAERDALESTPLHVASECGRANAVAALLDAGALLEARDARGFTPLAGAVLLARASAVRGLLARGADARATDARGRSVLQLAASVGDVEIVRTLLSAGADPRAADDAGWTSLHEAAAHGRTDVVRLLAQSLQPQSLAARTSRGATALHLAARRGEVLCVEVLLDAGLDAGARDADGRTARDLAPREIVDAPWARLGEPTPRPNELRDDSALLDAEPRRPAIFVCRRPASSGPEQRISLELVVWSDGAIVLAPWSTEGARECVAGLLSESSVQSTLRDVEETGWFDMESPADPESGVRVARTDQTEWILERNGRFVRRVWDSVDRPEDFARTFGRARYADWVLTRAKAGDVLRGARPDTTRALSFVLLRGQFRGLSFDGGVRAAWIE